MQRIAHDASQTGGGAFGSAACPLSLCWSRPYRSVSVYPVPPLFTCSKQERDYAKQSATLSCKENEHSDIFKSQLSGRTWSSLVDHLVSVSLGAAALTDHAPNAVYIQEQDLKAGSTHGCAPYCPTYSS